MKWTQRLGNTVIRFMRGRYGVFDTLNKCLAVFSLLLIMITVFSKNILFEIIGLLILAVVYYRFFSKKIYKRANENSRIQKITAKILQSCHYRKMQFQDRKSYRYFTCTNCRQHIRIPRSKGKIMVTCPKCHEKFAAKS